MVPLVCSDCHIHMTVDLGQVRAVLGVVKRALHHAVPAHTRGIYNEDACAAGFTHTHRLQKSCSILGNIHWTCVGATPPRRNVLRFLTGHLLCCHDRAVAQELVRPRGLTPTLTYQSVSIAHTSAGCISYEI